MFTKFQITATDAIEDGQSKALVKPPNSMNRTRRHQVSRACSWCRTNRIRCDDKIPCRNCLTKGRQCTEKGTDEIRTFSLAVREINRLKSLVARLEEQLDNVPSPWRNTSETPSLPKHLDPHREHGGNRGWWQHIYTRTESSGNRFTKSQQTQCHGPSSSFYFMAQVNAYLGKTLKSLFAQNPLLVDASTSLVSVDRQTRPRATRISTSRRPASTGQDTLSRWQEEHYLGLFWQSYACIYPVVDEAEFMTYHDSLWTTPYEPRKPSALVDILLAVSMQYGTALIPLDWTNGLVNAEDRGMDAAAAGKAYYRRCQTLIGDELERPSLQTLQCLLFSAIYQGNAGQQNSSHSMLALACRTGVILGLHREPLEDLDEEQKDFHRRLWWTVYALEIKATLELGRPLAVNMSQVTCNLPKDTNSERVVRVSIETSVPATSDLPSSTVDHDFSYTCNLEFVKLNLASRAVYIPFYSKCADLLGPSAQNSLHANLQGMEASAEFLTKKMEYLRTWARECPEPMKAKRRGKVEPFSVSGGSLLVISPDIPFIQQRQQLFLELHYHTVSMNILRPFISFYRPSSWNAPTTEGKATACVDNAMTITNTIHQVLTETNLLRGWLETLEWHNNAFVSLIGYASAYPTGTRIPQCLLAIRQAVRTFDILSCSLVMAASFAKTAQDLASKVELLISHSSTISMLDWAPDANADDLEQEESSLFKDVPDLLAANEGAPLNEEFFPLEIPSSFNMNDGMDWSDTINEQSDFWNLALDQDANSFGPLDWMLQESLTEDHSEQRP